MKAGCYNKRVQGLTFMEVFIVIAILCVLAMMIPYAHPNAKFKAQRIACVNNLKEVALAIRLFEGDSDRFHFRHSTNIGGTMEFVGTGETFRHFQLMSNVVKTPQLLVCPADTRLAAPEFATLRNANLSYFVGVDAEETQPNMLLVGDRNITNGIPISKGILELNTNTSSGWTAEMHNRAGNIGLADGSVQQATDSRLREALRQSGTETTRLAMP